MFERNIATFEDIWKAGAFFFGNEQAQGYAEPRTTQRSQYIAPVQSILIYKMINKDEKMKQYFLTIVAIFSILSCYGENSQADGICGKRISKSREYFNSFYFTKQTAYLDSALQILKEVENCSPKYTNTIFMDEMQVCFLKEDFTSALVALKKVPANVFPFLSLKDVFENKIRAKEAELKGDTISQRKYYCVIISLYQQYIDQNTQMVVTALCQPEYKNIGNKEVDFVVSELYYYISKTEGIENAIYKLENYQKNIQGNAMYFNELKNDIKRNNAKKMGILLY